MKPDSPSDLTAITPHAPINDLMRCPAIYPATFLGSIPLSTSANLAAAISGFLVTAGVLWAALRNQTIRRLLGDSPNSRSLHKVIVPRVGGLAILAGILTGVTVADCWPGLRNLFLPFCILAVICALDDHRPLSPWIRLAAQLVVATASVLLSGLSGWGSAGMVLLMVWSMNLYNFMDGSDGLAGGMAVAGFSAYALAAGSQAAGALPMGQTEVDWLRLACFLLASSSMAFLLFNFSPARAFLGDAGSVPLGFAAAAIGVWGVQLDSWSPFFPLIVFFPFLFDATLTLSRRLLRGEKVWMAHREHLYQRAILSGMSHRQVSLRAYGIMAACAAFALAGQKFPIWTQGLIILSLSLAGWRIAARLRHTGNDRS